MRHGYFQQKIQEKIISTEMTFLSTSTLKGCMLTGTISNTLNIFGALNMTVAVILQMIILTFVSVHLHYFVVI